MELIKEELVRFTSNYIIQGKMPKIYFYDNIPEKKITNAIKSYCSDKSNDEVVLLLQDNTTFGSAKFGFLFTDKYLYYYLNKQSEKGRISNIEIETIDIQIATHHEIIVNGKNIGGILPNKDDLNNITELFQKISSLKFNIISKEEVKEMKKVEKNIEKDKFEKLMEEAFIGLNVSKKHFIKAYEELLFDDELIQAIVYGRVKEEATKSKGRFAITDLDSDKGGSLLKNYIIITNERVILWARGAFNSSNDSFEYNDIKSVEQQKGIMYGSIVLNVFGKTENFYEMDKKEAEIVRDLIRNNIIISNKNVNNTTVNQISNADEIKKHKQLLDDGILTEEEFNMKKKQLLGL